MAKGPRIAKGARVMFSGIGAQHRGNKQGDVVNSERDGCCTVRFDDGARLSCAVKDLHEIQRRPPPDF